MENGFMKTLITCSMLILLAVLCTGEVRAQSGAVTLSGQVVCSDCWFEEKDRKVSPYGTESDLKCAVRCSKAKIPQALAVMGEAEATLYLLENGKFKKPGKDWLEYVGKQVEITGSAREKGDKKYLKVDALRVISEESAAPQIESNKKTDEIGESESLPVEPPEMSFKDLAGQERRLADYRDRSILVVNFWATWCVPCREEMPILVSLQKRYAARGVQVIGISADAEATQKAIPPFIKKAKINFPVWIGATTREMRLMGLGENLPATAIIDRDGKIAGRIIGMVEKADLDKRIDWLLGDRSTPAPPPLVDMTAVRDEHDHGHGEEGHTHGEAGEASTVPN
ncbi:MAG TPA: TlpA disulfide reductase family protein [Blastocatellia bacterium]|nr:TlpA disulfide reductase family protein [Blastocatellia bacterium]